LQRELIESREWDVLIVLDACRYDVFRSVYGDGIGVKSAGSCTAEWFIKTFTRPYKDTIYVSGNPFIADRERKTGDNRYRVNASLIFKRVINAWDEGWREVEGVYTVDPAFVATSAILAWNIHRPRRMIVHFLQPHAPYLCPELRAFFVNDLARGPDVPFWEAMKKGAIPRDIALRCYTENLRWVMKYAMRLVEFFKDKGLRVVITGDHGEAFGEHGYYNHDCEVDIEALRMVPWVVL